MTLINVKVTKIIDEADGVRSFLLAKSGIFPFPKYTPGAHIDVHCGKGIIRQYSLCGDPDDRRHLMIAVKLGEPSRGGSELMHHVVREGDRLEIGSPRNNFPLDETAAHAVLLAGGIGITPIIAMADRLHASGTPFALHYFTRSAQHTAFQDRLSTGDYAENVSFHQGLDIAQTSAALTRILGAHVAGGQVYICGPGPFMDAAEHLARTSFPAGAIKLERFAANPALAGAPTTAFTVKLARSRLQLDVGENQTILDVLDANGINAAFSCEQGVCGTCVTEILKGAPDHRDSFLSARQRASGKQMCICVSRAKDGYLELDL